MNSTMTDSARSYDPIPADPASLRERVVVEVHVLVARGQRVLERLAERTAHHLDDLLVGETARATRAQLEKFNPMLMPLLNYLLRNKNRGDERHRESYVSGDVSFVI